MSNEYATHNVILPQKISYDNPYKFIVTAENGDVALYTVQLARRKTRELKLSNIEVKFNEVLPEHISIILQTIPMYRQAVSKFALCRSIK